MKPAFLDLLDVFKRFVFDNVYKVAFDEDPTCLNRGAGSGNGNLVEGFTSAFIEVASISAT